jgi:hypothetical protein
MLEVIFVVAIIAGLWLFSRQVDKDIASSEDDMGSIEEILLNAPSTPTIKKRPKTNRTKP